MIKSEKGNTQIKGLGIEILADFSVMTYAVFKHLQRKVGEDAEEIIRDCFETGLKTGKEKLEEAPDVLDDIEKLLELLKEIKKK